MNSAKVIRPAASTRARIAASADDRRSAGTVSLARTRTGRFTGNVPSTHQTFGAASAAPAARLTPGLTLSLPRRVCPSAGLTLAAVPSTPRYRVPELSFLAADTACTDARGAAGTFDSPEVGTIRLDLLRLGRDLAVAL